MVFERKLHYLSQTPYAEYACEFEMVPNLFPFST